MTQRTPLPPLSSSDYQTKDKDKFQIIARIRGGWFGDGAPEHA